MKKEDERVSGHTSNKVRDPEECCTKVEPEKISEENHLPLADDDLSTAMEILGALDVRSRSRYVVHRVLNCPRNCKRYMPQ